MIRSMVRILLPLRMRHQLRLLVHKYPYELRSRFPDLEEMRLRCRPVVFDVGANAGYFAEAALAHRPWALLHLFEPLPRAFAVLGARLEGFGGLRLNNVALGRVAGERDFCVSRFDEASSFLELGPVLENRVYGIDFTIEGRIPVLVETLTGYVRDHGIRRIDLLKLDVQGFELEVLRGGEAILHLVTWIYAEAQFLELYRGGPKAEEIERFLADRGFDLVRRTSIRYDDAGTLMECDLIFRRRH